MGPLNLAVLFWFYRDVAVCTRRLRRLRELNPGMRIFGLYGGELPAADAFESALRGLLDDFYVFPEPRNSFWKWRNGDLMIARWFADRGSTLEWDSVFVAQWDLLLLEPVSVLCRHLQPDELILSGLRPISQIKDRWWWTREGSPEREEYERFLSSVRSRFGGPADPLCCNAVTLCLPRSFLSAYVTIPDPELGFLEYKVPIYSQVFGSRYCTDHPFQPEWIAESTRSFVARRLARFTRTYHAEKQRVLGITVATHALLPRGRRVFHPYIGTLF